jgi:hypothetical protein
MINASLTGRRRRVYFEAIQRVDPERFQAKACPGLDPGWTPVRVKKTLQNKKTEPRSDAIGTEKALCHPLTGRQ